MADDVQPTYQQTMAWMAGAYGGFTYPWRAKLDPRNGEDAYTALVEAHLGPDKVVVEAGCAQGAEALAWSTRVGRLIAFDFTPEFIALARSAAARSGVRNVEFLVADCSPARGGGVPAADGSVDLIVSRRGPSSFIADARRVLRPGGAMVQVAYMATPVAPWSHALPAELQMREEPESMPDIVLGRLAGARIPLHSAWTFDVPEVFDEPEQLYRRLAWDRKRPGIAPYEAHRAAFERLFERCAQDGGLTLRHRRFLWKAVV